MISTTGLASFRDFCKRSISYAKYKVGSAETQIPLTAVTTLDSGVIRASMSINNLSENSNMRVTRVELYNQNGELFAYENVSITLAPQTGILYWFDFKISEVSD